MKILFALLLLPALCFATDRPTDPNAVASASSKSDATADSAASSDSNISIVETHPDKIKNVPNVYPPDAPVTAPCVIGYSGGLGVQGLGIGGAGGKIEPQCDLRMTAREFFLSGDPLTGRAILCLTDAAIKVHGSAEKCVAAVPPAASEFASASSKEGAAPQGAPVATAASPCVTTEEVKERERKVLDGCVKK